jgi:hypothetical protein
MYVAVVQLTPGVTNADYRPVLEDVGRETLRAHPCAACKVVVVFPEPPLLTA